MWHSSDIGVYGFNMALNIDCLQSWYLIFCEAFVEHIN